MRPKAWFAVFSTLLVLTGLVLSGCGKPPGIATYPVSGTVTYNDKPVVGATVTFISDRDAPRSSGTTDEDGKYSLTTYVNAAQVFKGAPVGDYNVIVLKNPPVGGPGGGSSQMEQLSPEERIVKMQKMMQQTLPENPRETQVKPKSEVPEKYGRVDSTTLKATVAAGENQGVDFKLRD